MILDRIIAHAYDRVAESKKTVSLSDLSQVAKETAKHPSFYEALKKPGLSLIAEVKKASPSAGVLIKDYHPEELAKTYKDSGASAISVLTEPSGFLGDKDHIKAVAKSCSLPILQKDFFVDEYQIYEAKALGASAILLIAAILNNTEIAKFQEVARSLELDSVVEVHTEEELDRIVHLSPAIIGINSRNLKDFSVDLEICKHMHKKAKNNGALVIAESGVKSRQDMEELQNEGFDGVLIGTAIVMSASPEQKIKELLGRIK